MFGRWFGGGGSGASYERGMAALARAQYDAAIEAFEEVLSRAGETDPLHQLAHFYRGDALGHLGRGSLLRGDDAEALRHFDAALECSPNYPDLRLARAVARLRSGDVGGALSDARSALQLNPRYLEAQLVQAQAHRELNEPQSAEGAFAQAAALARERDAEFAATLARSPAPARESLLAWILAESRRREAIQGARALLAQGFWREARVELELLVAAHPRFPDLRSHLAQACFQLGEHELARQHLHAALDLHPHYADAALLLAVLELRDENVVRANELFAIGEDAAHSAGMAAYGRAACAFLLGQWGECGLRLRALPDEFAATHWLRLALALRRGDRKIARTALGESAPSELESERIDLILCAREVDEPERARQLLESLPPGAPSVEIALLRCDASEQLPPAQRIRCLRAALDAHPDAPPLLRALARAQFDAGELPAALESLSRCPAARCAESQQLDFELLRAVGREDLLCELELAPPLSAWLERLSALRQSGRLDAARALRGELSRELPLALSLRLQDPRRWAAPLLRSAPAADAVQSAAARS